MEKSEVIHTASSLDLSLSLSLSWRESSFLSFRAEVISDLFSPNLTKIKPTRSS